MRVETGWVGSSGERDGGIMWVGAEVARGTRTRTEVKDPPRGRNLGWTINYPVTVPNLHLSNRNPNSGDKGTYFHRFFRSVLSLDLPTVFTPRVQKDYIPVRGSSWKRGREGNVPS